MCLTSFAAFLAALVVAVPASATNVALPLREHVVTEPVAFGDGLVWVSQREGVSYVRERSPDGTIRTVLTIPAIAHAVPAVSVARTSEQVGIQAIARQQGELISDTSWWAAPGRPFVQTPPCTIAVGDDYILSSSPTGARFQRDPCDRTWVIRTTGASAGLERKVPEGSALAGDLYAFTDDDDAYRIHVRNWRSDTERYSVPGTSDRLRFGLTLGPTGTVRFFDENEGPMLMATPADPVPRRATDLARLDSDLVDLADGLALDRRRLTWLARPCAVSWIMDWNLDDPAPRGPSGACGISRLRAPRAVTIRRSTIPSIALRVRVSCPRRSDGCDGRVRWEIVTERRSVDIAAHSFTLLPGQSRTLTPYHSYRGRSGRPSSVRITGQLEGANARSLRRTIRVRQR